MKQLRVLAVVAVVVVVLSAVSTAAEGESNRKLLQNPRARSVNAQQQQQQQPSSGNGGDDEITGALRSDDAAAAAAAMVRAANSGSLHAITNAAIRAATMNGGNTFARAAATAVGNTARPDVVGSALAQASTSASDVVKSAWHSIIASSDAAAAAKAVTAAVTQGGAATTVCVEGFAQAAGGSVQAAANVYANVLVSGNSNAILVFSQSMSAVFAAPNVAVALAYGFAVAVQSNGCITISQAFVVVAAIAIQAGQGGAFANALAQSTTIVQCPAARTFIQANAQSSAGAFGK